MTTSSFIVSTVGEEKTYNSLIGMDKDLEAFSEIMDNLNLPAPVRLEESLPGNMHCGAELN